MRPRNAILSWTQARPVGAAKTGVPRAGMPVRTNTLLGKGEEGRKKEEEEKEEEEGRRGGREEEDGWQLMAAAIGQEFCGEKMVVEIKQDLVIGIYNI